MGVKWQEHEAEHSPPIIAEVKKTWIKTFTILPYLYLRK
jgi:hypothetical protein